MKEKRQNNSKKFMAIIAIVIMIGLIIGMGAVTYSKYVTNAESKKQTATAAQWGFVISVDANDLFGKNYTKGENANLATKVTDNGVAVKANGNSNVVAPGTTGSMKITISGSAEVKSQLSFSYVDSDIKEISFGDYKPVKWTLKDGSNPITTDGTLTDLLAKLNKQGEEIDAGTNLDHSFEISWEWDFDNNDNNYKDTSIGYKAANKNASDISEFLTANSISENDYNSIVAEMAFALTVSIEQIQE